MVTRQATLHTSMTSTSTELMPSPRFDRSQRPRSYMPLEMTSTDVQQQDLRKVMQLRRY